MKRLIKPLLLISGSLSLVLAAIGLVIPVLPTTPFVLLAAVCFARSSDRFYNWLVTNRLFGVYLRNYRAGRGIPWREKMLVIAALWITIGVSAYFIPPWWGKILLLCVAAGVTAHLLKIKTLDRKHIHSEPVRAATVEQDIF